MNGKNKLGLNELYRRMPTEADKVLWGHQPTLSRRGFLSKGATVAVGAAIGMSIPFSKNMPAGLIPAAFAADNAADQIEGKDGLIVLNDRPVNA